MKEEIGEGEIIDTLSSDGGRNPATIQKRLRSVYVISATRELVKVGISVNPTIRMIDLQRNGGRHLTLEYARVVSEAAAVEREAHGLLDKWRIKGIGREWFRCDPDMAVEAVKSVVEDRRERFLMYVDEQASVPSLQDRIREAARRAVQQNARVRKQK